jgi:UDP-glucose:(heptosyl)LPS alpha-1,3-glucosyltransferase
MKIAFIAEHYNPGLGGAETYMNDFSQFLIKNGHEVHFYTQDHHEDQVGLFFHLIKVPGIITKMRWLQWLCFSLTAAKQTRKAGFDVVMGTGKCLGVNVFQPHGGTVRASHRQNALLLRSPLKVFVKGISNLFNPKHTVAKWIESRQYKNLDCEFVAISQMVKGHMQEFYNIPDERISLVYNGIDTSRFSPATDSERLAARETLSLPQDEIVFSTVAHNFKLKGIRELIEAAAELVKHRTDFKIVIAGHGKQRSFSKLALEFGVAEQFIFLGAVKQPELVYQASDVYLQATWYDPCSLVVLEALAAGLPTVTTKFNGAGELIASGVDGYVISRPDAKAELSKVMLDLFDADLRRKMSAAARVKIKDQTLAANFNHMLAVFEKSRS